MQFYHFIVKNVKLYNFYKIFIRKKLYFFNILDFFVITYYFVVKNLKFTIFIKFIELKKDEIFGVFRCFKINYILLQKK